MRALRWVFRQKKLIHGLFVLYLVLLLRATVFRWEYLSWDSLLDWHIDEPWNYYRYWIAAGNWRMIWIDFRWNFIGNVIGFTPFGGYLKWKSPKRPLSEALICGAALSLGIEVSQSLLGVGTTSVCDLMTNAAGGLLGGWMMEKLLRWLDMENEETI